MSSTSGPRPSTPGGHTRSQAGEAHEGSASTVHGVVPTRTVDVVVLMVDASVSLQALSDPLTVSPRLPHQRQAPQRPRSWR
ncbi:hypothetical protein ACN28S_65390 [Cystobacter fuscus]